MDAIYYKVTDECGCAVSRAIYNVLGINRDGHKKLLGMYISKNESANFWLSVLTDLQNRGVEDILIAYIDGLKGFPEAIQSVYPNTAVQLCIVHQIRNSVKYVGSKNQKEFLKDLKCVYQTVNKESAENELLKLDENRVNSILSLLGPGRRTGISCLNTSSILRQYVNLSIPQIPLKVITDRYVRLQRTRVCSHQIQLLKNWFVLHTVIYGRSGPCHWLTGLQSHDN